MLITNLGRRIRSLAAPDALHPVFHMVLARFSLDLDLFFDLVTASTAASGETPCGFVEHPVGPVDPASVLSGVAESGQVPAYVTFGVVEEYVYRVFVLTPVFPNIVSTVGDCRRWKWIVHHP